MGSFEGFRCTDCGATAAADAVPKRCVDCGGVLDATYDVDVGVPSRDVVTNREAGWLFEEFLPVAPVEIGEGATPLVEVPRVADELDVAALHVKDEGRNPTGSVADRELAVVAAAAVDAGADGLALASTGADGQSAAAYAARAGLDARVVVPSRASFVSKAMINVHGGDMRVVEGRYDDAVAAAAAERTSGSAPDDSRFPAGPFDSPYRREGAKPVYHETVEALDWRVPDAVVVPVGHGSVLVGVWKAARELDAAGLVDGTPRVVAAQPAGCAPVVEAVSTGGAPEPWPHPDTVVGALEIPDPSGGRHAVEAIRDSGGTAVPVDDEDALDAAATLAHHEGLELGVAGGVAAAGAWQLREDGALTADDTVVVVNPGAGSKDADVVRSRLMGRGM
jgi:threonine synthase